MCGTSGRQGRRAGKEKVVGGEKRVIKTTAFSRRLYHGMQAEKERRDRDRQSDSLCRRQHPMVFPSPLSFSFLPLSVCEFVSLALLTTRKVCQLNKFCASNEIQVATEAQQKPNKTKQQQQREQQQQQQRWRAAKKIRTFALLLKESEFYLLNFITYTCRCSACVNNQNAKRAPSHRRLHPKLASDLVV